MAHVKGTTNWQSSSCGGKQSFLPPKSPFPSMPPAYADYGANPCIGAKGIPKPRDGQRHHQRTSSESFITEEQPLWLDDLLNEPETPVRRGAHRRSSSDSFAYMDMSNIASNMDGPMFEEYKHRNITPVPSWSSHDFNHCKDVQYSSYYADGNSFRRTQIRGQESTMNSGTHPNNMASIRDKFPYQCIGSPGSMSEPDTGASTVSEKQNQEENASHGPKPSPERKDERHPKNFQPDTVQKRVKQQFAQRSRVRKLQYIAELERNVQALQAEGSDVSAELQFLDQQNLILSLENKTLKQRLESVAQEQLLKRLQQEMLEREIARLRALCHQQLPAATHGRSNSRDLDSQFSNLSLKHKDANSGRDAATGPLHI